MLEAIKSWIIEMLAKIIPWGFRWLYTHEKLTKLIEVSINSENDGVVVNCSDLPDAHAWIEITNLSPFKLKLVGLEAVLYWVGKVAVFQSVKRIEISPYSKEIILVQSVISENQASHIKKNHKMDRPRLYVELYFESSIRFIQKSREIRTSNVRLLNCENA